MSYISQIINIFKLLLVTVGGDEYLTYSLERKINRKMNVIQLVVRYLQKQ